MSENFHLLLNIITYFLNFASIISLMFMITLNFRYFNMLEGLFKNWQSGIISDILVIENIQNVRKNFVDEKNGNINEYESKICPENYELLLSYKWPGTKDGCNCLGIYNMTNYEEFENKLLNGACSLILLEIGCSQVKGIDSKLMHNLGNYFICVKRNNFNYMNNYTNLFHLKCPIDYINCGIIDSVGNYLCLEKGQSCSINIESQPLFLNIESVLKDGLKNLLLNYFKSFIEFKMTQGNVCINNEEFNILSEDVYELYNSRKYIKCATNLNDNLKYDNRFKSLFYVNTSSIFYYENELKNSIKQLPNFSSNFFNYPLTIYGRKYIGWNKNCGHLLDQLKNMNHLIHKLETYSIIYLLYSLVVLVYCMLFIMIFKELIYGKYILKIIIIFIHLLLMIIIFLVMLDDYLLFKNTKNFLYVIIKKRCSDEETNRLMIFVLSNLQDAMHYYQLTITYYLIMIIISLFKIFLILFKIYKRSILRRMQRGNLQEFEMVLLM